MLLGGLRPPKLIGPCESIAVRFTDSGSLSESSVAYVWWSTSGVPPQRVKESRVLYRYDLGCFTDHFESPLELWAGHIYQNLSKVSGKKASQNS